MVKAMKCKGDIWRVEDENGHVEAYDTYDSLTIKYRVMGIADPYFGIVFYILKRKDLQHNAE